MNINISDVLMNKKITVDILMGTAIVLEFLSLPILIHEIIGIGLLFLIILHIKFNKKYFKAIFKGKYNLKRTIDLIINIGLLISLAITIISGIFSSQKSFKSLKIGNYKISQIHKSSSIISLIFLGLHLLTTRKKLLRELKKSR
nr:DUF4405 domain-containing protein [Methanobrevibacter sp.]